MEMPSLTRLLLALAGIICLAQASPCATPTPAPNSSVPVPPSQDRWYRAPRGFENAKPGAVLRYRPAPGNATEIMPNTSAAWNILYRTTDSHYKPSWAVTTLYAPRNPNPSPALISYQVPYDSVDVDSGPSYSIYSSKPADMALQYGAIFSGYVEGWNLVQGGWFLNLPDYEGPNASLGAGVMSGHATIDSVRAAISLMDRLNLAKNPRYAMWGYSGGALATEWAAELQVQYAPEMDFAGAAVGGLTPNLTSVLQTIDGGPYAGLAVSAVLGISGQYPDVQAELVGKLKTSGPYNRTTFLSVYNMSWGQAEALFQGQDISQYFVDGFADILSNPAVRALLYREGVMGYHGVPEMPIFAHKAIRDEVSPVADTDALVAEYCGMGANITYTRNTAGNHYSEACNGYLPALLWLSARLGGSSTSGCSVSNVTIDLDICG